MDACLDMIDSHWSGPVGVYGHTGEFIEAKWQHGY